MQDLQGRATAHNPTPLHPSRGRKRSITGLLYSRRRRSYRAVIFLTHSLPGSESQVERRAAQASSASLAHAERSPCNNPVVAGAHGVDEVHVARPEPDEGVHRQLRVVLLSLRPGRLHLLQGLGHGLLVHVCRGVQAPREVAPGRDALFKHVGRRGLGVPALAHVGAAPVLQELHVGASVCRRKSPEDL